MQPEECRIGELKVGLLVDSDSTRSRAFADSLKQMGVTLQILDLYAQNWHQNIMRSAVDLAIAIMPGESPERLQSFLTRISTIEDSLSLVTYPGRTARSLYENKQAMSDFMVCNGYPSAATYVYSNREAAGDFARRCALPIVVKSNFGSGSSGVEIVKSRRRIISVVGRHFSVVHPYFAKGYAKRIKSKRFPVALPVPGRRQRNLVILQEYLPVLWEWRIIRIGEKFFTHKKLPVGGYASGTLLKAWETAPSRILDFARVVCDDHDFPVMCLDIFELPDGRFVLNELQCQFGQSTVALMMQDGIEGYLTHAEGRWSFQEGRVTQNRSSGLITRAYLDHFISRHAPDSRPTPGFVS